LFSFDPFIEKAFEKIKDAGLAPVYLEQLNLLRSHLAFISERLATMEKDAAKAENMLEAQAEELQYLRSRLSKYDGKAKLVEIGPCFVKETPDGKSLEGVYCPNCQMPMDKGQYGTGYNYYYQCMKCNLRLPCELVEPSLTAYKNSAKERC